MAGEKPIAKFKAGGVSAAVWAHQATVNGRPTTMLKASVERRYRDASGTWKSSTSMSVNEISRAVYCLQKAFEYIIERGNTDGDEIVVEEGLSA